MTNIPDSHPRKSSLLSRLKMVDGAKRGLLADSAMIAHGRGRRTTISWARRPLHLPHSQFVKLLQGFFMLRGL